MEGMFLQSVPVAGSLIAAGLLLALVVAALANGWLAAEAPRAAAGRESLQKAA